MLNFLSDIQIGHDVLAHLIHPYFFSSYSNPLRAIQFTYIGELVSLTGTLSLVALE
jgi:hypothetical protein